MSELEKKITEAAQAYYSTGKSELSDDEFDVLVDELRKTNPDSPVLKKVGWGYDVNIDTTPGEKYPHKYGEAGSLEKCRTWNEIKPQFKNTEVDISLKLDGLSVVLYYKNGNLYQALTRGNGEIGIDITDKVHFIAKYVSDIDCKFTGAVRGEIVMSFKNFERYKILHNDAKNPRNVAAGLINKKEVSDELNLLDIVVYSVVGYEGNDRFKYIWQVRNWLRFWFRYVAPNDEYIFDEISYMDVFCNFKEKWSAKFPSDGLVITTQELKQNGFAIIQESQAFKFKSETAQSKVLEIEWNMSKTGYAVPRVRIEPVQLAGTTVQHCTGYNAQYIKENQLGVGSIVQVEKRGEIIPNINEVIAISGSYELPKFCPDCHSELQWDGVNLKCVNPNCSNATIQDTMIWTNELAPIDNLGELLKEKFFIEVYGEVPAIESLMQNKPVAYQNSYEGTQGYRMKQMFDKLFDIESFELVTAIKALNIPRFGDVNAAKLAKFPDYVHKLLNLAVDGSCADGISAAILESELSYAVGNANTKSLFSNLDKVARLRFIESRIDWSGSEISVESKGKVAVTGKLSVKRADFEKELISAGYIPADIAKDTKFLITDNPDSSSSKNKKANAWGIVKITEQEFREKYLR
ncbi:MAG: hypothetical protein NC548_58850 [Lachnospiraceae bacterium]|nr:hypothetical protein [Lachnospiraceae bacterium]